MDIALLVTAFATLFVTIDPIGLTPMFVALTRGADVRARRAMALRACTIAAVILVLFTLLGENLLGAIGISMPAFRIAGGLLLFLTALDMLFEKRTKRREDKANEDPDGDPSVFPLAIPLIAGPGAIASVILLAGDGGMVDRAWVIAVALSVVLVVLLMFLLAPLIERLLGHIGITVATRLLGMLLAALAVQFVLDGLVDVGIFTQ